jgi:hypothetical protein
MGSTDPIAWTRTTGREVTCMPTITQGVPVLTAVDVQANAAFWVDRLGFAGGVVADGFAIVRRDDVEVFMASVQDQLVPDNTMAWLRVRGLDALHASWSGQVPGERGPNGMITPITEQPWGKEFVVIDPAGNCVHFAEAGAA